MVISILQSSPSTWVQRSTERHLVHTGQMKQFYLRVHHPRSTPIAIINIKKFRKKKKRHQNLKI